MPGQIEPWAKENPAKVAGLSAIMGFALSVLIVSWPAYNSGFSAGIKQNEKEWQGKFSTAVAGEVQKELPEKFKEQFDTQSKSIENFRGEIKTLSDNNKALQSTLDRTTQDDKNRKTVVDLFKNLVDAANQTISSFKKIRTQEDRIKYQEDAKRLITQIYNTRKKTEQYSDLFDDLTDKTYDRIQRNDVDEKYTFEYLDSFASYPEKKLAIAQDLQNLAQNSGNLTDNKK